MSTMNTNMNYLVRVNQRVWAAIAAAVMLVLMVLPLSAEADAATTTVSSAIGSTISLTSTGTVNINATPATTSVQTIANDTVTVSTNSSAGYTLKLNETTAVSTLTSGSNTIAPVTGTLAAPVAQTAGTWGYRVDGAGGFGAGPTTAASNAAVSGTIKFAPVPATASPDTIKTTATTATNDTTKVWYGVAVSTSTPTGTYTNSVTYTALAN